MNNDCDINESWCVQFRFVESTWNQMKKVKQIWSEIWRILKYDESYVESLFSSNIIHFKCFNKDCHCDETDYQSHIEWIICINKDHTSNVKISEVIIFVIQRLAQRWKVIRNLQQLIDNDDDIQNERELFILKI